MIMTERGSRSTGMRWTGCMRKVSFPTRSAGRSPCGSPRTGCGGRKNSSGIYLPGASTYEPPAQEATFEREKEYCTDRAARSARTDWGDPANAEAGASQGEIRRHTVAMDGGIEWTGVGDAGAGRRSLQSSIPCVAAGGGSFHHRSTGERQPAWAAASHMPELDGRGQVATGLAVVDDPRLSRRGKSVGPPRLEVRHGSGPPADCGSAETGGVERSQCSARSMHRP